jgi:hypothetical protein
MKLTKNRLNRLILETLRESKGDYAILDRINAWRRASGEQPWGEKALNHWMEQVKVDKAKAFQAVIIPMRNWEKKQAAQKSGGQPAQQTQGQQQANTSKPMSRSEMQKKARSRVKGHIKMKMAHKLAGVLYDNLVTGGWDPKTGYNGIKSDKQKQQWTKLLGN